MKLDALIDVRNAIAHGDQAGMKDVAETAGVELTKPGYRRLRRALDQLAATMDRVVGEQLAYVLDPAEPPR